MIVIVLVLVIGRTVALLVLEFDKDKKNNCSVLPDLAAAE